MLDCLNFATQILLRMKNRPPLPSAPLLPPSLTDRVSPPDLRRAAPMKSLLFAFLALTLCPTLHADPLYGFSPAASRAEEKTETNFRAGIQPQNCRAYMEHLSARPHHVGSPYDEANAQWILAHFKEWGWDAKIETFEVLFPTPKTRLLEMTEPVSFKAGLLEPPVPEDPTSGQTNEQLPT